jgi:hypothetical protein
MTPELKAKVRATPRDQLIVFHLDWGTQIRNDYGLWRGNTDLLNSCAALAPGTDAEPEPVSMVLIERVWAHLQTSEGGNHGSQ